MFSATLSLVLGITMFFLVLVNKMIWNGLIRRWKNEQIH